MTDFSDLTIFDWLGFAGVLLYIGNYLSLQLAVVRGTSYRYIFTNILAASLVLISLSQDFNMSSAVIQMTWIAISFIGLTRRFILSRLVRYSPEEKALIAAKFPGLSPEAARPFLRAGHWVTSLGGTRLATEGETIGALIYLAEGEAKVTSGSKTIGFCSAGSFVGELTCFDGGPASATVELTRPSHYFLITTENLQRIRRRHPEFGIRLENSLGDDTRSKLRAANSRLTATSAGVPG